MLKTMRRYRRSLLGFLALCAIVLVMTGFGLGFRDLRSLHDDYAVRVDGEHRLSRAEFAEQKRSMMDRYRSMLGANFAAMQKGFLGQVNQQIVDQFVADTLTERFATGLGVFPPEGEVQRVVTSELFPDGVDTNRYAGFLRSIGMTPAQFERKLMAEAQKRELNDLLSDAAVPSDREIKGLIFRDETTYDLSYLEFGPEAFEKDVDVSDEAKLQAFYNDHTTDYELPARVSYDYIVFEPMQYRNLVEVQPDDVELYYTENESKYSTAEEVKARHIVINIPKGADETKKTELRTKAEEARAKANAGEPFESLVAQYSDDFISKAAGGDLGWIKRGTKGKAFDDAAFKLKDGGVTEVLSNATSFELVSVDGYKPSTPKPLEEVRAQIVDELKGRDAPAYTAEKARSLFDEFSKFSGTMKEFADKNQLAVLSAVDLLEKGRDPAPTLKGLTDQVLLFASDKKQIVELADRSAIVSVREYRESEIPDFKTSKERVVRDYKKEKSKDLAKSGADAALRLVSDGTKKLSEAAAQYKLSVRDEKGFGRNKPRSGPLSNKNITKEVLAQSAPQKSPSQVYESEGKYYLVQVNAITRPEVAVIDGKLDEYRERAASDTGRIITASLVNALKADSKIELAPGVLGEDS